MKSCIRFLKNFLLIFLFRNVLNIKVEEVRACIKEIIFSYYMRGKNIQYGPKEYYYPPEEATRHNLNHLSCYHFTNGVYLELINTTASGHFIGNYSEENIGSPEVVAYAKTNNENNLEMKYYAPTEPKKYKTIINPNFTTILSLMEIGDILIEPSHWMIVYDIIKDNNGNRIDAILIHSMSGIGQTYIRTKVPREKIIDPKGDEFRSEKYTIFFNGKLNSKFEGVEEATIVASNLSRYPVWGNMSTPQPRRNLYVILRVIQENEKGQAIYKYKENPNSFNYYYNSKYVYNDVIELTKNVLDRIKYKHLYIEKIVDKNTGSYVEIGEFLTYTIIIKNNGQENYKEDLIVTENLSPFVTYKLYYANKSNIYFEYNTKERKLIWNIGKLKAKEEIIINYIVKVTSGKPYDILENIGYVGNIPSSIVQNIIGINLNEDQKKSLKRNFLRLKNIYNGKKLINEIYRRSFDIDLKFDEFDITKLIINTNLSSMDTKTLYLNKSNEFYNTVINKYWASISAMKYTYIKGGQEVTIYNIKYTSSPFKGKLINERIDFLYEKTFKTGDILLYINRNDIVYTVENGKLNKNYITYENGEYAYIYIEGEGFVGINYGDDGIPNTKDDRNEFTAKYYKDNNLTMFENCKNITDELLEIGNLQTLLGKDYFVILRPSLYFNIPTVKITETSQSSVGNVVAIIIVLLLGILIVLCGLFILDKYLKMKKEGIAFNFANLKRHLLS